MNVIKIIKISISDVYSNLVEYLKSIFILQGIRFIIAIPIITFIFKRFLSRLGLSSITENDFINIFKSPTALVILLILVLVSLFFIYYEIGYYFLLSHYQNTKTEYKFKDIIIQLNKKAKYFLSFQAVYFFVYFLLVIPLAALGLDAGIIKGIRIPNFITDEILKNNYGQIIYITFIILVLYLSLRLIYTVPFFVIDENIKIKDAIKKSFRYSKNKTFKTLIILIILVGLHTVLVVLSIALFSLPIILIDLISSKIAPFFAAFTLTILQWILFIFYGLLQVTISEAIYSLTLKKEYSTLDFNFKKDKDEIIKKYKKPFIFKKNNNIIKNLIIILFIIVSLYNYYVITEPVYLPKTKIIAHRGYTKGGVENTLGSLEAAAKFNPDYIELDIQETKDNEFVVFHDSNLSRLSSRNENIKDLTLKELQEIEVSSGGFKDNIPSLRDFIRESKKLGVNLLVEVKPTENDSPELVKNLINLLKEEEVYKNYLIQSLDITILDEIKEMSPEIKTGHVIGFNIGSLPDTSADFIVLEEFSINKRILKEARENEIDLFVWTINDDNLIEKYLNLNVGGIITDSPENGYIIRDSFEEEKVLVKRLRWILKN